MCRNYDREGFRVGVGSGEGRETVAGEKRRQTDRQTIYAGDLMQTLTLGACPKSRSAALNQLVTREFGNSDPLYLAGLWAQRRRDETSTPKSRVNQLGVTAAGRTDGRKILLEACLHAKPYVCTRVFPLSAAQCC